MRPEQFIAKWLSMALLVGPLPTHGGLGDSSTDDPNRSPWARFCGRAIDSTFSMRADFDGDGHEDRLVMLHPRGSHGFRLCAVMADENESTGYRSHVLLRAFPPHHVKLWLSTLPTGARAEDVQSDSCVLRLGKGQQAAAVTFENEWTQFYCWDRSRNAFVSRVD